MQTIPTHFDEIKKALEFDEMSTEEQEELMLDLSNLIFNGTMLRVMEHMDEQTKEAFHKLIEKDASQEELAAFIQEHVPGSENAVAQTVNDLTNDILSVTKE